jgi:hypothetical protein
MAQPARVNHEERERQEEERKRRKKASQQLYNHRKTPDEGMADFAATAQMDSHATLLSQVSSAEQQAKLITQLQQSYGNAYVQRLIERIQAEKGSGRPLEPETRSEMEVAFKQDLGDVRVHTGATADKLTEELGAQAFTSGKDIFFRGSAYQPGSESGRELLGHELTHVVQQEIGTQVGQMAIGQVGDTFEREATWAGQAVSEGREVSVETVSAVPALQRQEAAAPAAEAPEMELEVTPRSALEVWMTDVVIPITRAHTILGAGGPVRDRAREAAVFLDGADDAVLGLQPEYRGNEGVSLALMHLHGMLETARMSLAPHAGVEISLETIRGWIDPSGENMVAADLSGMLSHL